LSNEKTPKVVIRQIGRSEMQVWDIINQKVYICSDGDRVFLSCFDPQQCYYFFEPLFEKIEPYYDDIDIPTLSTVSPDESRYKEFKKHGAKNLYMPLWKFEELSVVKAHMMNKNEISSNDPLYTDEAFQKRFLEFGGIFRHMFITLPRFLSDVRGMRDEVIRKLDLKSFMLASELDPVDISHLIAQYSVKTDGSDAFEEKELVYVSEYVREQIRGK
jgi:hypothetical protein